MTDEEETKAMSRLLTQGAKMLQQGCDDCGNPLFRYQGEVVCPVCNERRSRGESTKEAQPEERTEGTVATDPADAAAGGASETAEEEGAREKNAEVDEYLRALAERLARDAVEHADDPEAVERRLDALERTLALLRR